MFDQKYQPLLTSIIPVLKEELATSPWWQDAHEEVKEKLFDLIDNVLYLGLLFKNSFFYLFWLEVVRRRLKPHSNSPNVLAFYMASILNVGISDEVYQCAKLPTKNVLGIDDLFFEPNDADVMSCIYLHNRLDLLSKVQLLLAPEKVSEKAVLEAFYSIDFAKKVDTLAIIILDSIGKPDGQNQTEAEHIERLGDQQNLS